FQIERRCFRCGERDALYKAWRKFTMNVVTIMTTAGVAATKSCTATNCAEPANTTEDMPSAAKAPNPPVKASTPYVTPNGIAPRRRGNMAFTPARNSTLDSAGTTPPPAKRPLTFIRIVHAPAPSDLRRKIGSAYVLGLTLIGFIHLLSKKRSL